MVSKVRRLIAALIVVAVAVAPALLGACAAGCADGKGHGTTAHQDPLVRHAQEAPDAIGGPSRTIVRSMAHDGHAAGLNPTHNASAASLRGQPPHQDGMAGAVKGCCGDATASVATPGRLVERGAALLLDTPGARVSLHAGAIVAGVPDPMALPVSPGPHQRPLVLRI